MSRISDQNCFALGQHSPKFGQGCYFAPGARLIGDIVLGDEVSVWFNAVLRGDNDKIRIGSRSNIQDGAVLHVDPGHPLNLAEDITVGHQAMLHGCTVERGALIGIQAVVLNDAVIGAGSLIGANSLVPERMIIPPNSLVVGSPARVVRELGPEAVAMIARGVQSYVEKAKLYTMSLE